MSRREQIRIVKVKYRDISSVLNERSRRCWAATEARAWGRGGITAVACATGMAHNTIRAGLAELNRPVAPGLPAERIRREGGGRKRLTMKDPELEDALDALVEPTERGHPESPLRWTCESTTNLAETLSKRGHPASQRTVYRLLVAQEYSLQANRKTEEGTGHPDRDAQFRYINESVKRMQQKNQPAISVDTKKKENLGNFKNNGREWRKKGTPRTVNMHDFADETLGKVIPHGVYDLSRNEGWVTVGVTHDTASFAVASIKRWWKRMGSKRYADAHELMITADSGGSNANRSRLWKAELQNLADELCLTIHVRHFPPGTSKWNKIEHRLFSCISRNWRGKPLLSRASVVNLIANTTTKTGLTVKAVLDEHAYETGRKVADEEMASLNLTRESFHGEWNYRIEPKR